MSILLGVQIRGNANDHPTLDIGASWSHSDMTWIAIASSMLSKLDISFLYRLNKKTTLAFSCITTANSDQLPTFEFGVKYKPEKRTILRAKVSEHGDIAGNFKITTSRNLVFRGFLSVGRNWSLWWVDKDVRFNQRSVLCGCWHRMVCLVIFPPCLLQNDSEQWEPTIGIGVWVFQTTIFEIVRWKSPRNHLVPSIYVCEYWMHGALLQMEYIDQIACCQ